VFRTCPRKRGPTLYWHIPGEVTGRRGRKKYGKRFSLQSIGRRTHLKEKQKHPKVTQGEECSRTAWIDTGNRLNSRKQAEKKKHPTSPGGGLDHILFTQARLREPDHAAAERGTREEATINPHFCDLKEWLNSHDPFYNRPVGRASQSFSGSMKAEVPVGRRKKEKKHRRKQSH